MSTVKRFVIALSFSLLLLNTAHAQAPAHPEKNAASEVHGYSMLDANRVYSTGQEVRVEEPHGVYTGLIVMDDYYFLRPLTVSETERKQAAGMPGSFTVSGSLSANVRSAISPSWKKIDFVYGCDDRDFSVGRTELARVQPARAPVWKIIVGDHNAVCSLKTTARPPEREKTELAQRPEPKPAQKEPTTFVVDITYVIHHYPGDVRTLLFHLTGTNTVMQAECAVNDAFYSAASCFPLRVDSTYKYKLWPEGGSIGTGSVASMTNGKTTLYVNDGDGKGNAALYFILAEGQPEGSRAK